MQSVQFNCLADTERWSKDLVKNFKRPCVILLDGDLGVGKTQMVRWFVEALGGTNASSPTYAIHQAYPSAGGDIDHMDLYRIESQADLESTGFWDLLKTKNLLLFVEWADRLPGTAWPNDVKVFRIKIHFELAASESRRIEIV